MKKYDAPALKVLNIRIQNTILETSNPIPGYNDKPDGEYAKENILDGFFD